MSVIFFKNPWLSGRLAEVHGFSHMFCSNVDIGLDPDIGLGPHSGDYVIKYD
jgi:hypothetical protein